MIASSLLGSAELTFSGNRKDSGDIDIAIPVDKLSPENAHAKMSKLSSGRGTYNKGTKVGSYAVSVGNKNVQVDLMFVSDVQWAKFIYHSSHGKNSNYSGVVRNIMLFTALTFVQQKGKDFVERDKDGNAIARASRSVKMNSGMERLFKARKHNPKTGKFNKSLETVTPNELEEYLDSLGKKIKFSKAADITSDPDEVASFIFGSEVKAKDIMTAENVAKHIKTMKNADDIIAKVKSELKNNKLPIPSEL